MEVCTNIISFQTSCTNAVDELLWALAVNRFREFTVRGWLGP